MKKRCLSLFLAFLLIASSGISIFALESKQTYEQYLFLCEKVEYVQNNYPEATIFVLPSEKEFNDLLRSASSKGTERLELTNSYTTIDDNGYEETLDVFSDGSFALTSIFGGKSSVQSGAGANDFIIRWDYVTMTNSASIRINTVRSYGSSGYCFDSPSAVNCVGYYVSFYQFLTGGSPCTSVTFKGNYVQYDSLTGLLEPQFAVDLTGSVNPSTGTVSASHSYFGIPY